jgi:hypothetical protein
VNGLLPSGFFPSLLTRDQPGEIDDLLREQVNQIIHRQDTHQLVVVIDDREAPNALGAH